MSEQGGGRVSRKAAHQMDDTLSMRTRISADAGYQIVRWAPLRPSK